MRISINKYLIFFVVVGLAGLSAVHAQQADSLTLQAAIQSALENNTILNKRTCVVSGNFCTWVYGFASSFFDINNF